MKKYLVIIIALTSLTMACNKNNSTVANSTTTTKPTVSHKKLGGLLKKLIDITFDVTCDVQFGHNIPNAAGTDVLHCVNEGVCWIKFHAHLGIPIAPNGGATGGMFDANIGVNASGSVFMTLDKSDLGTQRGVYFPSGIFSMPESFTLPEDICTELNIPNGTVINAGNYPIYYEDNDYIVVKF